jgi:hypothetical protein
MFSKKWVVVLGLMGAIAAAVSAADPVVTIVNNTGYSGWYLYASRSSETNWNEDDLLGDDVLNSGSSVRITLSGAGIWDFKLVDSDGDSYVKMNYSVRDGSRIEFTFDDYVAPSSSSAGTGNTIVPVVNNTGYEGYYLYASPSSSDSWGSDQLGTTDTLSSGSSVRITLADSGDYDFKLVDSDGDSYTKMGYSVSNGSQIEFTMGDYDGQ